MLVYEYMHNGTLRDHMHGMRLLTCQKSISRRKLDDIYLLTDSSNQKHLDWLARLRIAEDAAKGWYHISSVHVVVNILTSTVA